MANIAVFCGARKVDDKYVNPAYELGKLMAEGWHTLIYWGWTNWVMWALYRWASEAWGRIIGIIPEFLKDKEKTDNIDPTKLELIIVDTMDERKKILFELSDTVLMLPGWIGTLDESLEAMTLVQLKQMKHKIGILNTDKFYDPLVTMLNMMTEERFLEIETRQALTIKNTPAELLDAMHL